MKNLNFLLSVFVIFTILELNSAYKWPKDKIPNPFEMPPPFCNLKSNGPLCDPDSQLESHQIEKLLEKQKEITNLYKCPCDSGCKDGQSGLVVGLVFLKEYDDPNSRSSQQEGANPASLQDFASFVREQWKLGSCDNSVLIAIATNDKQYGISIGEKGNKVLNDTWLTGILEENFRDRTSFNLYTTVKNILFMYHSAIKEELASQNELSETGPSSLSESNNNGVWYTILILFIIIFIIAIISLVTFVILRHRKENDDVSLRDVWTKKFWLQAGNQYKAAKQTETQGNGKDIEKNDDDEDVKVKLASTEDLKTDDIENVDEDKLQYPKLSKV